MKQYVSLSDAKCSQCDGRFNYITQKQGYSGGRGEYRGTCNKCKWTTHFEVEPNAENTWERAEEFSSLKV
mgnify:CR=1